MNSNSNSQGKTISGGVLNSKAISLPQPAYAPAARAVRATGAVSVQVLVDERGEVVNANAVSGHPLLRSAAVQAARKARFAPTKLSGQPVKVSGVLTFRFSPK
jgi:protein TonB